MKHLLLLAVLVCFMQSAHAQSTTMRPHHKHYKKHYAAKHNGYQKHNIKVSDNGNENDNHNVYEGKPSRSNDGVKKNEYRNMNVGNTNAGLAPSNGSNSK